jgi:aromatic ring-cleaving dioxygenase
MSGSAQPAPAAPHSTTRARQCDHSNRRITGLNRIPLVLFDVNSRVVGPYLTAMYRIHFR